MFDNCSVAREVDLRLCDAKLVDLDALGADTARSRARVIPKGATRAPGAKKRGGSVSTPTAESDYIAAASLDMAAAVASAAASSQLEQETIRLLRQELQAEQEARVNTASQAEVNREAAVEQLRCVQEGASRKVYEAQEESRTLAASLRSTQACLEQRESELLVLRKDVARREARETELQAELQELKGAVRVLCRIRPLSQAEKVHGSKVEPTAELSSGIYRSLAVGGEQARHFDFDRVYGMGASNDDVFEELMPLAKAVAGGSRTTVLAYGQTGSGKTYTMNGLQRLAVGEVLRRLPRGTALRLGVVEVYNDRLTDLLGDATAKLEVRQGGREGLSYCEGLSWHAVGSGEEAERLVARASERRVTTDNGLNERSSRSHLICLYQVEVADAAVAGTAPLGQLALVDLAGSERLARVEASGLQAETAAINKSLSALGDVMTAIAADSAHVPFRNSKLTHVLQPALSRGSRVMFIIAASPAAADMNETLVALGFGARARKAQLGPERGRSTALARSAVTGKTPQRPGQTPDAKQTVLAPKTPNGAIPSGANRTPGGVNKTPGGLSKTPSVLKSPAPPGGINKTPGGLSKTPVGMNKTPGGLSKPSSALKSPAPPISGSKRPCGGMPGGNGPVKRAYTQESAPH
mmetsp:Transcript_11822/g.25660  ORF Transcript_11822/g.25660 Transcript_11822/m.25660 type:complete len:641 (-) Transcript_11822:263-2185(-)